MKPDVLVIWAPFSKLFFFFFLSIYLFIYDCVGSSSLREGSLQLWQAGATLHRGARTSHYRGLSCCGAQAPDAQAQQLWPTGLVAPQHVGSSQTRARTRVPCIGRQTLTHCVTREAPREAPKLFFKLQQCMVMNTFPDANYRFSLSRTSSCLACRRERKVKLECYF